MSLNAVQYQSLFTNNFGADPAEFGITIDASQDVAVGRANGHEVKLTVVQGNAIDWQVDGQKLMDWPGVLKPIDPQRATNGDLLRSQIA